MNDERGQLALPKLYGAPAYARPPLVPVAPADRPFDPDDLPLESERTGEESDVAQQLQARPYASAAAGGDAARGGHGGLLRGRAFRLHVPGRPGGSRTGS